MMTELNETKSRVLESISKRHEEYESVLNDAVKAIEQNKKSIKANQAEIDRRFAELNDMLANF